MSETFGTGVPERSPRTGTRQGRPVTVPYWTLQLLAVGLSADAFAVAVGKGLGMRRLDLRAAASLALTFGLFQAVMPLLGWGLGAQLAPYIASFDHWIAFGLLTLVGGKMLQQARRGGPPAARGVAVRELLLLGVATSIDALAVGLSFALLRVHIGRAVALIGVTTLALTLLGVVVGFRLGARLRGPAEAVGGLVLIAVGVRIVLDHLGVW